MNNPPSTFTRQTTPCPTCKGERTVSRFHRISGEAVAGVFVDETCTECEGTGEIEAVCAHCENDGPLDAEGMCACCSDIPDECGLTELKRTGTGGWL